VGLPGRLSRRVGPVTVGADGTVYVAGLVKMDQSCEAIGGSPYGDGIYAVNPDGTQKWLFAGTCNGIIAGPNVGPDGKIYAVSDVLGIGVFALTPQGSVAFAADRGQINEHGPTGAEIVFGPAAPGLPPTQMYFQFDQSALDPQGQLFGYTLQGQRLFTAVTVIAGQPAVGPLTGSVYAVTFPVGMGTRLRSYTPQGVLRWQSPIWPNSGMSAPDAGPDDTVYVTADGSVLHAVDPGTGQPAWAYDDPHVIFDPVVSPDNRLVLLGGRITYGEPGFFAAVSRAGQLSWKQQLPDEPGLEPYGQVVPFTRPRFTADGQTAYVAADIAGDYSARPDNELYSYFYALDTSAKEIAVNQEPKVTITSPLDNSNHPKNAVVNINVTASDDQPVAGVEFFAQRTWQSPEEPISTDTAAPYAATYNLGKSSVMLIARVRDAGGLVGESRVWAMVSNEAPRVSWVSPTEGAQLQAGGTVTLTAQAADPDGTIAEVNFFNSLGGFIGKDTTPDAQGRYEVVWQGVAEGQYELHAQAYDDDGLERRAVINVGTAPAPTPTPSPTPTPTPSAGQPPAVRITSPADNSTFAPGTGVSVTAEASDADGTIARVEFYHAPYQTLLGTDFNAPYAVNVSSSTPSVKRIYARAFDNSGNAVNSGEVRLIWEQPNGALSISGVVRHQASAPGNELFLGARSSSSTGELARQNGACGCGGKFVFDRLSYGGAYSIRRPSRTTLLRSAGHTGPG
jgi:outer membrane protein assembly factor BamB